MATFRWIVEIEIDEVWVVDGFNPTAEEFHEMVENHLQWATGDEIKIKILYAPDPERINKAQLGQ